MTGFSNTYGPVRQLSLSDKWTWEALPIYPSFSPTFFAPPSSLRVTGSISELSVLLSGTVKYKPAFNFPGNILPYGLSFDPTQWTQSNCTVSYQNSSLLNGVRTVAIVPTGSSPEVLTSAISLPVGGYTIGVWAYNPYPSQTYVSVGMGDLAIPQSLIPQGVWTWVGQYSYNSFASTSSFYVSLSGSVVVGQPMYIGQPICYNGNIGSSQWGPGAGTVVGGIPTTEIAMIAAGSEIASFPFVNSMAPHPGSLINLNSIIGSSNTGSVPPVPYELEMKYSSNDNPFLQVDATATLY